MTDRLTSDEALEQTLRARVQAYHSACPHWSRKKCLKRLFEDTNVTRSETWCKVWWEWRTKEHACGATESSCCLS